VYVGTVVRLAAYMYERKPRRTTAQSPLSIMPIRLDAARTYRPRVGLLFDYDWDARAHQHLGSDFRFDRAGFDLFSFPSNARLIGFDLARFAARQAERARARGWAGVVSHHEQFGALGAALVAEAAGLPGTSPEAVIACQHKLHARRVLQSVCPEANVAFDELDAHYGGDIPPGLAYPRYVKPVKAAFSVLARPVRHARELHEHTRFGRRELWVIRRLVEPFERIARLRLPGCGSAHRMLLEEPLRAPQYNLDGYMLNGQLHVLGIVDAVMYPGTQAFMRFDLPTRLPAAVAARAAEVARTFLGAVGFRHGLFNMEFFHDPASDRLAVIEFNPRLASQFSDLYRRVQGLDAHALGLALATGREPSALSRIEPSAGAASSFVYRNFDAGQAPPPMPGPWQRARLAREFPDAMLFTFAKSGHSLARDFKWLGSHRYGILHLGGRDAHDLRRRCEAASAILGWPAPYASPTAVHAGDAHAAALNGYAAGEPLAARAQPLR
jgi:biotin carboxylase